MTFCAKSGWDAYQRGLDRGYMEILLTQKQKAKVNVEDYQRVNQYKWHACYNYHTSSFYAANSKYFGRKFCKHRVKVIYLSRFIMNAPKGKVVDHINHDTLDNRRENLRVITNTKNLQNRKGACKHSKSGIRNVHWHKRL